MFKHLQKLDVSQATSWFAIPEIAPKARMCLRPATQANAPYFNALLRMTAARARKSKGAPTVEDLNLNRDEDRVLFPRHVITGWEGVEDEAGKPVPFSRENAAELCAMLPEWLFDRVRAHANSPEMFLDQGEVVPDVEELSKNSAGDSGSN